MCVSSPRANYGSGEDLTVQNPIVLYRATAETDGDSRKFAETGETKKRTKENMEGSASGVFRRLPFRF